MEKQTNNNIKRYFNNLSSVRTHVSSKNKQYNITNEVINTIDTDIKVFIPYSLVMYGKTSHIWCKTPHMPGMSTIMHHFNSLITFKLPTNISHVANLKKSVSILTYGLIKKDYRSSSIAKGLTKRGRRKQNPLAVDNINILRRLTWYNF